MSNITRAEIKEIISTRQIKVLRATIDPRTCENYRGDTSPHPDDIALLLQVGDDPDDLVVIGIDDTIARVSQAGEQRLYSYDESRNILASLYLNNNAEVVVNEGTDYAVAYTKLENAFNTLKQDFDNLVTTYNTHIHTTTATVGASATPGVISPTTSTGSPSTADITIAKIEKVRLPDG